MLLILHILVAFAGLIMATWAAVRPSRAAVANGWGLTFATLATGTVLVVQSHASLTHACITGAIYLVVASTGLLTAVARLKAAHVA